MTAMVQLVSAYGGSAAPVPPAPSWNSGSDGLSTGDANVAPAYGDGWWVMGSKNAGGSNAQAVFTAAHSSGPWAGPVNVRSASSGIIKKHLAFGNGVFVARSDSTAVSVASSADLSTWVSYAAPAATLAELFFAPVNGLFVWIPSAVGTSIYTSPDGVTWTLDTLPASAGWLVGTEDASDGTLYIATLSTTTKIVNKPLGGSWSAVVVASGGTVPYYMAAGNGKVVFSITSSAATTVKVSSDSGATWNSSATIDAVAVKYGRVRYLNGYFYLLTDTGAKAYYSANGINWTAVTGLVGSTTPVDWISDGAGNYIACGDSLAFGYNYWYSS